MIEQNNNPYGELHIEPSEHAKVDLIPQINQIQNQSYAYPNQVIPFPIQPLYVIQPFPVLPIKAIDPQYSDLLQYQVFMKKKRFSMLITAINLFQTVIAYYFTINYEEFDSEWIFKNGSPQWTFYIISITTIFVAIGSRFLTPSKNYALQWITLACFTVLYGLFAFALAGLFQQQSTYFQWGIISYGIGLGTVLGVYSMLHDLQSAYRKLKIIQFFVIVFPLLLIFIFLQIFGYCWWGYIEKQFFFDQAEFELFILVLTIIVGYAQLSSLVQMADGKYQLKISDYAAAATMIYGNILTLGF